MVIKNVAAILTAVGSLFQTKLKVGVNQNREGTVSALDYFRGLDALAHHALRDFDFDFFLNGRGPLAVFRA